MTNVRGLEFLTYLSTAGADAKEEICVSKA
jgi:hypothetical protein